MTFKTQCFKHHQKDAENCKLLKILNEDVLICQNSKNADTQGVNANDETATKYSH